MGILYVVSDTDRAGKTSFCASLASVLMDMGHKVSVSKAIFSEQDKEDLDRYCSVLGSNFSKLSGQSFDVSTVGAEIKSAAKEVDTLLVEASNTLSRDEHTDLVKNIGAKVIHVTKYDEAIGSIPFGTSFGQDLIGTVLNFLTRYKTTEAYEIVIPRLEKSGIPVLGLIPENRTLLSLTVKQICESLEGTFVGGEEYGEDLVESFMVGGFGMDPGQYIFSRQDKKAVVVRGDRPDVQMSALDTDMECFIMTGGLKPIEYVKYEANEEEVSIIIVNSDTLETMDKIGTLQEHSEFDHKDKLARFKNLISSNIDVEGLKSVL